MSNFVGEPINMNSWIEHNKVSFVPPVCNKVMYDNQLKIMFVGGPNIRKDYHIEAGEEFFYMVQGNMCLKIIEKGVPKDVQIKEGEVFVLPNRIPHSPQRQADTVGLVIERERLENETDGLRYYCDDNSTVLYESWFHCDDLVKDLPPVIKKFNASEQCKTGKPIPGTIPTNPPVKIDCETEVMKPINFNKWIEERKSQICPTGEIIFHDAREFKVHVCGGGEYEYTNKGETWLWQLEGEAKVTMNNQSKCLQAGDCWILPSAAKFSILRHDNSIGLVLRMDHLD